MTRVGSQRHSKKKKDRKKYFTEIIIVVLLLALVLVITVASGFAVVRLLELWIPIPPVSWMSVSCGCCVSSGRGLCFGLITRTEES